MSFIVSGSTVFRSRVLSVDSGQDVIVDTGPYLRLLLKGPERPQDLLRLRSRVQSQVCHSSDPESVSRRLSDRRCRSPRKSRIPLGHGFRVFKTRQVKTVTLSLSCILCSAF